MSVASLVCMTSSPIIVAKVVLIVMKELILILGLGILNARPFIYHFLSDGKMVEVFGL